MSWLPLERAGFLRIRKADGGRVLPVRTPPRMDPGSVLERTNTGESIPRWSVRAVQQVVAHGMPRDIHRPVEALEETAS